jgi:hypothetical protein
MSDEPKHWTTRRTVWLFVAVLFAYPLLMGPVYLASDHWQSWTVAHFMYEPLRLVGDACPPLRILLDQYMKLWVDWIP